MKTITIFNNEIKNNSDGIKEVIRSVKDLLTNKLSSHRFSYSSHDILVMERYSKFIMKKVENTICSLQLTKEELQQSETMLKHAEAIAHLGCWELNFATGNALWSEECCRIYGLSTHETSQTYKSWFSFIHPEDIEMVNKEIKRAQDSLSDSFFYHRIICKDGVIKHINSLSKFKFDDNNKPIGLYGIAHDVTEQKKTEAEYLKSEKLFRTLIEKGIDMKSLSGPDGNVFYVSPSFTKVLGYSQEEIFAITALEIIHPDDQPAIIECLPKLLETPNESKFLQQRLLHKDGTWVWCEGTITNLLEEPGIHALVSNFRDITKRKEIEDKLKWSNKELETFIYKASHDLRSPLASIIGLTHVSKSEVLDEKALKYLSMIESATVKLDKILLSLVESLAIKDFSDFKDEIHFKDLIASTIEKFSNYPGFSSVSISSNVSFTASFVSSNFIIGSIFQNIIENAIKYRKQNTNSSYLTISVHGDSNEIIIEFKDNGIGIDKSVQDKVFDMYFRGTKVSNGSGLGLYLIKTSVEKLGGKIELSSVIGKGTSIKIFIKNNLFPKNT